MKLRVIVIPVAIVFAFSGCASEAPVADPSFSASESASPETPTPTPLVIPSDCETLLPTAVVHREFDSRFEPEVYVPHPEDEVGRSFSDRNGLICFWVIPRSEAYVGVLVAERGTDSDDGQVALWRSADFAECPPLLDACFYGEDTSFNTVSTVYALVDGFELRVTTGAGSLDALFVLAREAATNMGFVSPVR